MKHEKISVIILKHYVKFHSPLVIFALTLQVLTLDSLLISLIPLVRTYTGGLK